MHDAEPLEVYGYGLAVLDVLIELVVFEQQHTVVKGVAEEYTGKAGRYYAADAGVFHGLGGHLAGGTAAEVGPGNYDVALLEPGGELGVQGFKDVLAHLRHGESQVLRGDDYIRIYVPAHCPYTAAEYFFHALTSSRFVRADVSGYRACHSRGGAAQICGHVALAVAG